MKRILCCTAFIVSFFFFVSHGEISLPAPQGYVSDYAQVLSQRTRQYLEELFAEVERKTTAQIAAVTVQSLGDSSVEEFAVLLFERWGIGRKDKDNGVLILLAPEERKVRIETGYGLEGILPDSVCGRIIREYMVPFFSDGNYDKGMVTGSVIVSSVIARDAGVSLEGLAGYEVPRVSARSQLGNIIFVIILVFLLIRYPWLIIPLLLGGRRGYWGGGRGGFGGGFGGFGGGTSGGGGASGSW